MGEGFDARPEAGWVFSPAAWGRGYAVEAMTAALSWADATLSAAEFVCVIEPAHAASLRVSAKLGFTPFGEARLSGAEVLTLRRPRFAR